MRNVYNYFTIHWLKQKINHFTNPEIRRKWKCVSHPFWRSISLRIWINATIIDPFYNNAHIHHLILYNNKNPFYAWRMNTIIVTVVKLTALVVLLLLSHDVLAKEDNNKNIAFLLNWIRNYCILNTYVVEL